jgi:hypothetical protein
MRKGLKGFMWIYADGGLVGRIYYLLLEVVVDIYAYWIRRIVFTSKMLFIRTSRSGPAITNHLTTRYTFDLLHKAQARYNLRVYALHITDILHEG